MTELIDDQRGVTIGEVNRNVLLIREDLKGYVTQAEYKADKEATKVSIDRLWNTIVGTATAIFIAIVIAYINLKP